MAVRIERQMTKRARWTTCRNDPFRASRKRAGLRRCQPNSQAVWRVLVGVVFDIWHIVARAPMSFDDHSISYSVPPQTQRADPEVLTDGILQRIVVLDGREFSHPNHVRVSSRDLVKEFEHLLREEFGLFLFQHDRGSPRA